jgi:hypothetical protein
MAHRRVRAQGPGGQWMPAAFSRWVTNVLAALLYFWV